MHRFFLTERSLYVVVLDGRRDSQEADADYWLSHVEQYGKGSPAIVVLNKWESPGPYDLERRRLQRTYPFIRGFVETDCQTSLGLEALKNKLVEVIVSTELENHSWLDKLQMLPFVNGRRTAIIGFNPNQRTG